MEKIRDGLYIKKGFDGYRIVRPIKREDGSINWKHLIIGDWESFIKLVIILTIVIFLIMSYRHDTKECFRVMSSSCVQSCYSSLYFNISNFNSSSIITGVLNNESKTG